MSGLTSLAGVPGLGGNRGGNRTSPFGGGFGGGGDEKASLSGAPSLGGGGSGSGASGSGSGGSAGLSSLGNVGMPGFGKKTDPVSIAEDDDLDALFADKPVKAPKEKKKKTKSISLRGSKKSTRVVSPVNEEDEDDIPKARGISAARQERASADDYDYGYGGASKAETGGGRGGTGPDSPTTRLRQFLMEDDPGPKVTSFGGDDDDLDIFGTGSSKPAATGGGGLGRRAGRRGGSSVEGSLDAADNPPVSRAGFGSSLDSGTSLRQQQQQQRPKSASFADTSSEPNEEEEEAIRPFSAGTLGSDRPPAGERPSMLGGILEDPEPSATPKPVGGGGAPMPYAQQPAADPAPAASRALKKSDDWGDSGDILDMLPDAGGGGGGGGGGKEPLKREASITEEDSDPSLDMGGYQPSFLAKREPTAGRLGGGAATSSTATSRPSPVAAKAGGAAGGGGEPGAPRQRRNLGLGGDALRKSAPGTLGGPQPSSTPTPMSREERKARKKLDEALRHSSSFDQEDVGGMSADSSSMSMDFGMSAEKRRQRREERQRARESAQMDAETALHGAISRSTSFEEARRSQGVSADKPPLAASPSHARSASRTQSPVSKPAAAAAGGGLSASTSLEPDIDYSSLKRRYEKDTSALKEEVKTLSKMVASAGRGGLSPKGSQDEGLIARLREEAATRQHDYERAKSEAQRASDKAAGEVAAKDTEIQALTKKADERAADTLRREQEHQEALRVLRSEGESLRKEAEEARRQAAQARLDADNKAARLAEAPAEIDKVRQEAQSRIDVLQREAKSAREATGEAADELRKHVVSLGDVRKGQEEELRKHAGQVEAMRKANGEHLSALVEEQKAAVAASRDHHRKELEQADALHREALEAKDRIVQEERDMLLRHHSSAELLSELTRRVDASQRVAKDLQEAMASDRERTLRERGDRMDKYESHMGAREEAMARRERETEGLRLQLESLLATFDSSTREARAGMADEKLRLLREHSRLEALQEALVGERTAVREQVEAERRRLGEMREARAASKEVFMQECLEETRKIALEREEMIHQKERGILEEREVRERVLELERKLTVEAARLEAQQREREAQRQLQEQERHELERHVASLRADKDKFQDEIQRLTALGIHMQQKSEEVMHAAEANDAQVKAIEMAQADLAVKEKRAWSEGRRLEDERRALEEGKRNFDRSRVSMAQERQQLQEERVAASRAAEAARVLQLQLSEQMRRWAEQGFTLDDLNDGDGDNATKDGGGGAKRRHHNRARSASSGGGHKGNKQSASSPSRARGGGGTASALKGALRELGLDGSPPTKGPRGGGGRGGTGSPGGSSYLENQAAFLQDLRANLYGGLSGSSPDTSRMAPGGTPAPSFHTYPAGPPQQGQGQGVDGPSFAASDRSVHPPQGGDGGGGGDASLSFTHLYPLSNMTSFDGGALGATGNTSMDASTAAGGGGGEGQQGGAGVTLGLSSTDYSEGGKDFSELPSVSYGGSSPPSSGSDSKGATPEGGSPPPPQEAPVVAT